MGRPRQAARSQLMPLLLFWSLLASTSASKGISFVALKPTGINVENMFSLLPRLHMSM
jgi:hypothetical protein